MRDAAALLRERGVILLDFDGPVCAVFGPAGAATAAAALRAVAASLGLATDVDGVTASDPLSVLRRVAEERPDLAAAADAELRRHEVAGIRNALPTPGSDDFLRDAAESGHLVAIASNNAAEAITEYLVSRGLEALVAAVEGRRSDDPTRMKPDPDVLERALKRMGAQPSDALMIGDSVSDVRAAAALGVPCVAFANKPGKQARLRSAGADAVVQSMAGLFTTT